MAYSKGSALGNLLDCDQNRHTDLLAENCRW